MEEPGMVGTITWATCVGRGAVAWGSQLGQGQSGVGTLGAFTRSRPGAQHVAGLPTVHCYTLHGISFSLLCRSTLVCLNRCAWSARTLIRQLTMRAYSTSAVLHYYYCARHGTYGYADGRAVSQGVRKPGPGWAWPGMAWHDLARRARGTVDLQTTTTTTAGFSVNPHRPPAAFRGMRHAAPCTGDASKQPQARRPEPHTVRAQMHRHQQSQMLLLPPPPCRNTARRLPAC